MKSNDFYLLLFLLALTASSYFCFTGFKQHNAAQLTATVAGVPYGSWSLAEDKTITIKTAAGFNTLRIHNGTAKLEAADCPNKLCLKEKSISRAGDSIVCIPHKLVLRGTAAEAPEIDAVAR